MMATEPQPRQQPAPRPNEVADTMFCRPAPPGYERSTWTAAPPQLRVEIRRTIRETRWPLLIHGPTGTGKTSTAAMMYRMIKPQATPLWWRADDLLMRLTTGRADRVILEASDDFGATPKSMTFAQAMHRITTCRGLFLDDLGVRPPTPVMIAQLFDILEARRLAATIITTNHRPEALGELFGDRILSRLLAGTVLFLDGNDRREGTGHVVRVSV